MDDEHKGITKNENDVIESAENDTDCITWKRPSENEMVVSLDEFMRQNKTNSFRVSRRRHTWTPLEQEKKYADQDEYDEPEQVIFTRAIPLPNGETYNPDWAVAFKKGSVRHVCILAETKGSSSDWDLRGNELLRKTCAEAWVRALASDDSVRYHLVANYEELQACVNRD